MNANSSHHRRRSIRLKGYDYRQAGAYFITVVAQNRTCLLGEIENGEMRCNDAGNMIQAQWDQLPERFLVELDEFIVMPNHVHGILVITPGVNGAGPGLAAPERDEMETHRDETPCLPPSYSPRIQSLSPTLGNIVGAWKSITTDQYISGVRQANWSPFLGKLWQRNYYEHIVRDEQDLERIRDYITNNPFNWKSDENNPANINIRPSFP